MKLFILACLILVLTSQYNPKMARYLGTVETATYTSKSQIQNWSCPHCHQFPLVKTKVFNSSLLDIYGYTGYSQQEKAVIVAFRGTVDIQNWIANLDAAEVPYPGCSGCLVHQGFYNAFQSVTGYVRSDIQHLISLYGSSSQIYVTGFSLGGALATVAALQIKKVFGHVDQFYSFGQPRVGNEAFATHFASSIPNHFRVIHYADIVPHLPPQLPLPYSHFAYQIWYDEKMQKYKQCGAQEFTCSKSLLPNQWSTKDHDLEVYIRLPAAEIEILE